jgi:VanZ family protein
LKVRRWLPPLLWAGVIIFATSLPSEFVPGQISTFDKAAHFSMYAVLAGLITRHLTESMAPWRAAAAAVLITVTFGALDEWHQQFIPGRSTEFNDWKADSLGATTGALLLAYVTRRRTTTPTTQ